MTQLCWMRQDAPPRLCDLLLAGTVGREHLLGAASLAGAAAREALPALQNDHARLQTLLLAAAFEEDSLHGGTAANLLAAASALPPGLFPLTPAFAALLEHVARAFRIPEHTAYYARLVAGGDVDRRRGYLENECRAGRHRLFWLHVALRQAVLAREFDWGEAVIQAALPAALAPLAHKLTGDLRLLSGRPGPALACYEAAQQAAPWPTALFRRGLAAWQAGDGERAKSLLAETLSAMPCHVSAGLALFDLACGRDAATAPLPGATAIALYTFSKAFDLDRTLAALFASDMGQATVTVLDNASTDDTPGILAGWTGRVGTQRLEVIRLPVNIGAPAARNWLAAQPRLQQADFVAYLDDDVLLPPDWLARLGAAVAAYPEAGVWGCHVADASNPAISQGIDAMLMPPDCGTPAGDDLRLTDFHAEAFDHGAFAHMRPCLSVMGCCHLFRRERLAECGGFDIRFSPSQYDDVDHDLRLALSGRPPVYQGHLTVGHCRPAPVYRPPSPDQLAGGQANRQKLVAKHRENLEAIRSEMRRVLAADLAEKWASLKKYVSIF